MVSYGYTLDHIAPRRRAHDKRVGVIKPYPRLICAAVILGGSVTLWFALFEAVKHTIL